VKPSSELRPTEPGSLRVERFETAYRSLYAPVGAYVFRRVTSAEEAAEVVAETFLTLWRRFDDAPSGDALRPWTYGIARRVLANHLRGERRRAALTQRLVSDFGRVVSSLPDPNELIWAESRLDGAMSQLSEMDQELLRLVAWEGLRPSEVATALGIRPSAVRLRLHRARRRLQTRLDQGADEQHGAPSPTTAQREMTSHSRISRGVS
jgi:RNA polymerase sigma factor (sigma-70 family)